MNTTDFIKIGFVFCWLKNYMFRPAIAIIRFFFRKRFRRCYTVSVTAYWWDLVISVLLFTGSVIISGGSMWKGGWGVSCIKPRNYKPVLLWGGVWSICARSPGILSPLCCYQVWQGRYSCSFLLNCKPCRIACQCVDRFWLTRYV